jgi:hypothetical protein
VAFESRAFDQGGACPWFITPSEPGGSSSGSGMGTSLTGFGGAYTSAAAKRGYVPLGQLTCAEWNATTDAARPALIGRVRAFSGGVVVSESANIGNGATLTNDDARALYNSWCSRSYASGFLLYKLYSLAAGFRTG